MNAHARAYLALIAAALFWAGNYVFGKVAVAGMSPFSIVFLRWTIALVPLVAIAKVVEHPDWMAVLHHWRFLLMQGLLGLFAYNFLLYAALRTSSAFAASLINAANPALIALTALIVLHERVGWRGGVGIALALLGVLVVLTHGDLAHLLTTPFSAADLLMLGVIVVWTAYTIAARKGPRLPPITQVAIQTALIVAGLTFVAPFAGVALPDSTPRMVVAGVHRDLPLLWLLRAVEPRSQRRLLRPRWCLPQPHHSVHGPRGPRHRHTDHHRTNRRRPHHHRRRPPHHTPRTLTPRRGQGKHVRHVVNHKNRIHKRSSRPFPPAYGEGRGRPSSGNGFVVRLVGCVSCVCVMP